LEEEYDNASRLSIIYDWSLPHFRACILHWAAA
jgi:hypothetical protein